MIVELLAILSLAGAFGAREWVHYLEDRRVAEERAQERGEWTDERSSLLNRIKPETAQVTSLPEKVETPQPVMMDDDEQWWEIHGNGGS